MKNYAVKFHKEGYNCSQCILKAFEAKYNFKIDEQTIDMCKGISNGLGIGSTCSIIIAGVMIFGIMLEKTSINLHRINLLNYVHEKYSTINCCKLKRDCNIGENCSKLVYDISNYIDKIIIKELKKIEKP